MNAGRCALVYDPSLAEYRFPRYHPMRPERFTLAVDLMRAWGLLDEAEASGEPSDDDGTRNRAIVWQPEPATDDDLLLFHSPGYVDAVKAASTEPGREAPRMGLGPGDTPIFPEMHQAAALAVGATMRAFDGVLDGSAGAAFNPAGGLHHAQRARASGFCVYNDAAIAIERATRAREGLRVAYVDIDAHHGDGVQAAFYDRPDVLTLSVHESGRYLFPGTGDSSEIGVGEGSGTAVNLPMPPGADAACYELAATEVIAPALRAFAPDVILAQIGGDPHAADPLTHLQLTVEGHLDLVRRIIDVADEVCDRRIVLVGGGGYEPFLVVPRLWAGAMAELIGVAVPVELPPEWLDEAAEAASEYGLLLPRITRTLDEFEPPSEDDSGARALDLTRQAIERTRAASPLLG